MINNSKKSYS